MSQNNKCSFWIGDDNSIHLVRGDTARFSVPIRNYTDDTQYEDYDIQLEDTLTLTVKKNVKDDSPVLLQKVITGTNNFHIEPDDTRDFSFGTYVYDIQLDTVSGDTYTVITYSDFEITKEVTD